MAAPRRVIAIFPELGDDGSIAELRRRFDPLSDLVPPHVTVTCSGGI